MRCTVHDSLPWKDEEQEDDEIEEEALSASSEKEVVEEASHYEETDFKTKAISWWPKVRRRRACENC